MTSWSETPGNKGKHSHAPTHLTAAYSEGQIGEVAQTLRIVALDRSPELASCINRALWVWRYEIQITLKVNKAIEWCRESDPTALLVAVDYPATHVTTRIGTLRNEFPDLPIVALGTASQQLRTPAFLAAGANAFLRRDEIETCRLYQFLTSLTARSTKTAAIAPPRSRLLSPYLRLSAVIGSILVDHSGKILDANAKAANYLGADAPTSLAKMYLVQHFGLSREIWKKWLQRTAVGQTILRDTIQLHTLKGDKCKFDIEVFDAAGQGPCQLTLFPVDQNKSGHRN